MIRVSTYALLLLLCASSAWAHGDQPNAGKSAADARAELEQAWRDGLLPHDDRNYPASAQSIERNKQRYARTHPQLDAQADAASASASPQR